MTYAIDHALEEIAREKRELLDAVIRRLCTCRDFERRFRRNDKSHHLDCISQVARREVDRLDAESECAPTPQP